MSSIDDTNFYIAVIASVITIVALIVVVVQYALNRLTSEPDGISITAVEQEQQ
jgi:hypothetical protein